MANELKKATPPASAPAVRKEGIVTVREQLEKLKPQMAMALPKHITPERLMRVAMTAIQTTPKLLQCDRQSLLAAIMKSAQLGLEPDGILGQAYLIPYNTKKGMMVQFIPGYKGLIDLARRSGEVSNIIAKEVCEADTFQIHWHKEVPFTHEQPVKGDRGEVIGFWAMARFKDGGFHFDYMSMAEVLAIRDRSSGWQSAVRYNEQEKSPWHKDLIEMGKKTVIRRISKYLPMSVQRAAMAESLQDADVPFTVGEAGDIVLEGSASEVEDMQEAPASKTESAKEKLKAKMNKEPSAPPPAEQAGATPPPHEAPAVPTIDGNPIDGMTCTGIVQYLDHASPMDRSKFLTDNRAGIEAVIAKADGPDVEYRDKLVGMMGGVA